MASMTRHQLRAARALLVLGQEVLAAKAGVGVATIRRFENGVDVAASTVDALRDALETEGAVLVPSGTVVAGREVGGGVLMRREAELPDHTRERLAALDLTPVEAAAKFSPGRVGRGRRKRAPSPPAPDTDSGEGDGSDP